MKAFLLGSALLLSAPLWVSNAEAARAEKHSHIAPKHLVSLHHHSLTSHTTHGTSVKSLHGTRMAGKQVTMRYHGISCVPYARAESGIEVAGNAWQWWGNAQGIYARGDHPEAGSVLNFRANGRMRLGHVAVVTRVVNAREVIVDHANWPSGGGRGGVSRGVSVVDVSEANNWSAVRVEMGREGVFGSVYPTYGFIYNRPDPGAVIASIRRPAPQAEINPVPSDLRPVAERPWEIHEEVAEAPLHRSAARMVPAPELP
jgi:surface antigen